MPLAISKERTYIGSRNRAFNSMFIVVLTRISIKYQLEKAWFGEEADMENWPKYTLVKTSMDYSLEHLTKSVMYQCSCLADARIDSPANYKDINELTLQILDVTSNQIVQVTKESCDCMDEIINDIMCTDNTSGKLSKY